MKVMLTLLALCVSVFVFGCDRMQKPVMDVVSDPVIPVTETFDDVPSITVSDALSQEMITGPWLWMIAPTDTEGLPGYPIDADSLAIASKGSVTEIDVATKGVTAGDMVGDLTWTPEIIDYTSPEISSDNINDVIIRIGFTDGSLDEHSSYALINLVSDTDRPNLTMRSGSDDSIKIWLNGEVVHKYRIPRDSHGLQDEFKVDLKAGSNLLLVKVHDYFVDWAMFIGIEYDE